MNTFYSLVNAIQNYPWGSADGIPDFTGLPNPDSQPMAELWMGAHTSAPSRIITDSTTTPQPLDEFISADPISLLGNATVHAFGERLPFLFKVLSARTPLSLQVHPSKKQAEAGFECENKAGIPLLSPERNYKDNNHKPEILLALTPFTAMCGFRKTEDTLQLFSLLESETLRHSCLILSETGNYSLFLKYLLELPKTHIPAIMKDVILAASRISKGNEKSSTKTAYDLLKYLADLYPDDIGVLAPLYLNIVNLKPEEAFYLPSGVMHSYIRGTGLELMANSDNVLRGGLTHKRIDITELLEVVDIHPFNPEILPSGTNEGLFRYKTESIEFELISVRLNGGSADFTTDFPSICIGSVGYIDATSPHGEVCSITRGKTYFIPAAGEKIELMGTGTCFIASIPETGRKVK
jgi:mannose-6-phosphate isomerase